MFSLSLLLTSHHNLFKQISVRSSTQYYPSFNLLISRSPGFGSTATNSIAHLRLGFPPAPALQCINLAYHGNSQVHSTKGTPSPLKEALTACRSTVSGSISLPSRGAFHQFPHGTRSLSVAISYLALEGGPPRFRQGFSCLVVLRILPAQSSFRVRGFHPL